MNTPQICELRRQVSAFMGALAIPESTPAGDPPVLRMDGVTEFYKHWKVVGNNATDGLYATYSDTDDVIEFGLSERIGDSVSNVLQATLVLDEGACTLNVLSEDEMNMNYDAVITLESCAPLQNALRKFGDALQREST